LVYFGPLPALAVTADIDDQSDSYRIEAEVAPQSWIAWALPWTAHSWSQGQRLADGTLRPERHQGTARWGKRERSTGLVFADDRSILATNQPAQADSEREAVPPSLTIGALDPISAVLALTDAIGAGRGCPAAIPVFDGRRRFDLRTEARPPQVMASWYSAYAGPVQVCSLRFRSLAGGRRGGERSRFWQGLDANGERPPMELWLARPREGLPAIPIYATGESTLGWVTLYLSGFAVIPASADSNAGK
jgi:hypothetical protein